MHCTVYVHEIGHKCSSLYFALLQHNAMCVETSIHKWDISKHYVNINIENNYSGQKRGGES